MVVKAKKVKAAVKKSPKITKEKPAKAKATPVDKTLKGKKVATTTTKKTGKEPSTQKVNYMAWQKARLLQLLEKTSKQTYLAVGLKDADIKKVFRAHPELKGDRELINALNDKSHRGCGEGLLYASDELLDDREVIMRAVNRKHTGNSSLEMASERLKDDKGVVFAAVRKDALMIKAASARLQSNKTVQQLAYDHDLGDFSDDEGEVFDWLEEKFGSPDITRHKRPRTR
jgi:hypothetical protein